MRDHEISNYVPDRSFTEEVMLKPNISESFYPRILRGLFEKKSLSGNSIIEVLFMNTLFLTQGS